jgi:hypothetical protein
VTALPVKSMTFVELKPSIVGTNAPSAVRSPEVMDKSPPLPAKSICTVSDAPGSTPLRESDEPLPI